MDLVKYTQVDLVKYMQVDLVKYMQVNLVTSLGRWASSCLGGNREAKSIQNSGGHDMALCLSVGTMLCHKDVIHGH